MNHLEITASAEALVRQAGYTAENYLNDAIAGIDRKLGEGYAAEHPDLIAAFMQVAAQDFHTALMKAGIDNLTNSLTWVARTAMP